GAAAGAIFVALLFIGSGMSTAGTTQSGHLTGAQVLKNVAHQQASGSAAAGFVLEILGCVAFIGFLGFLGDVLRRRTPVGERIAAGTAVVAGVTMLAIKLGSTAPILALDLDRHTLSPQLAQMLNDINGAAFVVSWLPFAVLVAAMAAALRRAGLVGRPTAYVGCAVGAVGVVLTLVGLRDITNATPIAFMLGLAWLVVVSVRLAVKPGDVDEPVAPAPSYDADWVAART
ncbi:MAG TPA: hypothetical protein VFH54_04345, partial [Mycobacteriales bacterium]|nr:hypothetical protein [Mycobacteriales bacterium]